MINFNKNQTVYQALAVTANTYPEKAAFIYRNKTFTYNFLISRVHQYAFELNRLGFKKDDVITVALPNIPQAVYLLYAINQIGAIANIIHPLMDRVQLEEILINVKSKILFVLDTIYNKFSSLNKSGIRVVSVSPVRECSFITKIGYSFLMRKRLKGARRLNKSQCDLSYINNQGYTEVNDEYLKDSFYLHSGGTTGRSKTIALSSFALNALNSNSPKILDINKVECTHMLAVLPMFHGFGLCMGIHAMFCFGGINTLMPKFSAKECVDFIKKGQLNVIIGVPTLFEALLKNKQFTGKKLEKLDVSFVGGDFVSQDLVNRFNKRMIENGSKCRLFPGYGLTESVCVLSVNTHFNHKTGTVGKLLDNVNAKTCDMDTGKDLAPGVPGEIYISGETLMNGYRFDDEDANKLVFSTDENGVKWLRTGDYGFIDEERFVFFTQRLKRIVKVNGINIFPSDIENVVTSLSSVNEAAAIGVKDERFGSVIKLFVVLNEDYDGVVPTNEIKKIIREKCSVYAVPKEVVYIKEFKKTLIGKIDVKTLS